ETTFAADPFVVFSSQPLVEFNLADANGDSALDLFLYTSTGNLELALAQVEGGAPSGTFFAPSRIYTGCDGVATRFAGMVTVPAVGSSRVRFPDPCSVPEWLILDPSPINAPPTAGPVFDGTGGGDSFAEAPFEGVLADRDLDGTLDYVAADEIAFGRLNGLLGDATPLFGGTLARRILFGDLDGDGRLETLLRQAGVVGPPVRISTGPVWQPAEVTDADPTPDTIALDGQIRICDFNDDGVMDIAVTPANRGRIADVDVVAWLGAVENGAYSVGAPIDVMGGSAPFALDCGDLNNDGLDDLVYAPLDPLDVVGQIGDVGRTAISTGTGFVVQTGTFAAAGADEIQLAELTGDGVLDLVVSNDSSPGEAQDGFETFAGNVDGAGNGDGTFTRVEGFGTRGLSATLADIDGDGRLDLAGLDAVTGAADRAVLARRRPRGDLTGPFFALETLLTATTGERLQAGDLNNDGLLDLTYVGNGQVNVSLFSSLGIGVARDVRLATEPSSGTRANSVTRVAEVRTTQTVDGSDLPAPLIARRIRVDGFPHRALDPLYSLKATVARGSRTVLATAPVEFSGDVQLRWVNIGGAVRRRLEYRPELALEAEVIPDSPAAWFTVELPLVEASQAATENELRVFRLVPRWTHAVDTPADPLSTDADAAQLLPRVVDSLGTVRQVLERTDRWEEVMSAAANPDGARFSLVDAGTPDARLRIVSERLGVFVAVEML
ncbi:MAG: VCBS repeat-containing protein, partial [Myxococcota bacterium]